MAHKNCRTPARRTSAEKRQKRIRCHDIITFQVSLTLAAFPIHFFSKKSWHRLTLSPMKWNSAEFCEKRVYETITISGYGGRPGVGKILPVL